MAEFKARSIAKAHSADHGSTQSRPTAQIGRRSHDSVGRESVEPKTPPRTAKTPRAKIHARSFCKRCDLLNYGEGDDVTVVFSLMVVLVLVSGLSGFTTVVLFSVLFSAGGLVTVVSFCSQAVSRAMPAKAQMYFFIVLLDGLS